MLEGLPCTLVKFPSTARAEVTNWQPNWWQQHFCNLKGTKLPRPRCVQIEGNAACMQSWLSSPHWSFKVVLNPTWHLGFSTFRYAHSSQHSFLVKVLSVCTDIRLLYPKISQVFISKADHGLFWSGSSHSEILVIVEVAKYTPWDLGTIIHDNC